MKRFFVILFILISLSSSSLHGNSKIKVGIYNPEPEGGKASGRGVYEALIKEKDIEVSYFDNLQVETLSKYDVVILCCVKEFGVKDRYKPWNEFLRKYVGSGGGLLLSHDSCGYRKCGTRGPLFPEIFETIGRKKE